MIVLLRWSKKNWMKFNDVERNAPPLSQCSRVQQSKVRKRNTRGYEASAKLFEELIVIANYARLS